MDATQIILIVFIVLLIIIYPIIIATRNKKENQRMQEQTNSLKRGDKVLTTSGVYGTIVDLHLEGDKKIVTIETGTDKKLGYISVDAYAIYTIFKDEPEENNKTNSGEKEEDKKVEDKKENVAVNESAEPAKTDDNAADAAKVNEDKKEKKK